MTLPVKASMWYLACSVLQKAIGFLTTPIFTRVMGTSDFGVVSMYNSWEAIFTVFCTLYLYNGVYNNAMIEYKYDKDGFTSSMQTLTTVLSVAVFGVVYVFLWTFVRCNRSVKAYYVFNGDRHYFLDRDVILVNKE